MDKIKVLVFGLTDNIGGVETFYMSYYRKLNKDIFQIDFVTVFDTMAFESELIENGSKVYHLPNFKKQPIKYANILKKIIVENKYDIVHVNMLSAANILPLKIAYKCGVTQTIAHSHNSGIPSGFIRKIMHNYNKKKIPKYATLCLACSKKAGDWLFGSTHYEVLNNAIDVDKFSYSEANRQEIRTKLNLKNQFVIGHVGRFCEQKNQLFLIDIFKQYLQINNEAILILIGNGEDKEKVKNKISSLHLENNIIIVDNTLEVYKYYSAFDLFVLPSLFEGLSVVGIEAQFSNINCLFADTITKEIKITDNVKFLPIDNVSIWVNEIVNNVSINRLIKNESLLKSKYNINNEVIKLEKYYKGE